MYCKNCGTKLDDNARFCFGCGTPVGNVAPVAPPPPTPSYEKPEAQHPFEKPAAPKKKSKKGLLAVAAIIGGIVVVAALVAVLALSGLFGGDSVKVAAAMTKSTKAFTDAVNKMELTDVSSLVESKKFSEELALWINEIDGSSTMNGIGLRLSADTNLPGRKVGMVMTPFWGSTDLLTLQMKLDDSEFYVGSPELTGSTYYMINTETVFEDLDNMGADLGDAADISFNIFNIIEQAEKIYGSNDELTKAIKDAAADLLKEIKAEKSGTETIEVNEHDLKCTAYEVVITEESMHTFLEKLEEAYLNVDNTDAFMDLLESMGIPNDVIDEMEYTYEDSADEIEYAFEELHDVLEELGDFEMNVYINGGYVVAAVYENSIDDVDVEIILNIGGGNNYVDDISLKLVADDEEYRIVSSGNHSGAGNTFNDETVIEYKYQSSKNTLVKLKSSYSPKESEDNLSIKLIAGSVSVQIRGQMTCKKDSVNLRLDKVSLMESNNKLAEFGMELNIGQYEGDNISVKNHEALANMSQADLIAVVEDIGENINDWAMDLDADIQDMLSDIIYELY